MKDAADLRFPAGPFAAPIHPDPERLAAAREDLRALPRRLAEAVAGLDEAQLDTAYRPGGWSVRQLVHHLADSHLNAYCRIRLALTEDNPTVRTYDQDRWSELADAMSGPIAPSLLLLEGLHDRWSALLDALAEDDFRRPLHHPEIGASSLGHLLAYYGWHSRHHVAHITALRVRSGW